MNFLASATIIVEIPHSISFKWDPNQDYYPSFLQSEKKTIFLTVFEIHSKSLKYLQNSTKVQKAFNFSTLLFLVGYAKVHPFNG